MDRLIAILFMVFVGWLFLTALSNMELNAYERRSKRIAQKAGWEWVGCEKAKMVGIATSTVCLVKDENGKIVDIDNIRSDD